MAFDLPPLPFPKEPGTNNPYVATPDEGGGYAVPSGHYFKKKVGDLYLWVPVSESDPLPTDNANIDVALSALRDALLGTGNKTLSDLATALVPLATSEKQAELVSALGAIADAAVSDPAVSGTVISLLKGLLSQLQAGSPVSVTESNLPTGAATDAEIKNLQAKVDTLNAKLDAITDGTTPATTQLMGSNVAVEEYILADRAERRTVGAVYYPGPSYATALDVSHLGAKNIKIENMHNQAVGVDLYAYTSYGTFGAIDKELISIAAGTTMVLWSKDYPWLNEPMMKMSIYTNYAVAPTEGYLSIVMVGEPR